MRKWKTKRFLEYVYEDCLNCGKPLRFAIYEEADTFDAKSGKPQWDMGSFVHGEKACSCGAEFLIADDLQSVNIYWLNKDKMPSQEELKQRVKAKRVKNPWPEIKKAVMPDLLKYIEDKGILLEQLGESHLTEGR